MTTATRTPFAGVEPAEVRTALLAEGSSQFERDHPHVLLAGGTAAAHRALEAGGVQGKYVVGVAEGPS